MVDAYLRRRQFGIDEYLVVKIGFDTTENGPSKVPVGLSSLKPSRRFEPSERRMGGATFGDMFDRHRSQQLNAPWTALAEIYILVINPIPSHYTND